MTNSVHIHVHIDPQPLKFLEIPETVTGGCVPMVAAPKKVASLLKLGPRGTGDPRSVQYCSFLKIYFYLK